MQASTHKKIVFAGLGCGGIMLLLWVAILVFGSKLDDEPRPGTRQYSPAQAAAALDTLGRLDVPALAELPPFDERLLLEEQPGLAVVWRDTTRVFAVAFLDTFPASTARHRTWLEAGQAVHVAITGPRLPVPKSLPPPHQPLVRGRMLLSATRRYVDAHDPGAFETLRAALLLARDQEGRTDLFRQRVGARLERDALDMMSRDSRLGGALAPRARERLARLDSALARLTTLDNLIEVAGSGPADAATLAGWARDGALPLAVRDELIRAVGYGWVYNPLEVAYGMAATRRAAIDSLHHANLPDALAPTLEEIEALGKPGMTRRMTFSVQYRIERETL